MLPCVSRPKAIGSFSLENCCRGRSYFAIKLERISARWIGRNTVYLLVGGKVGHAFYTVFSISGPMCAGAQHRDAMCVGGRQRKSVWRVGTTRGLCNPFCRASTASLRSSIRERSENRVTERMKSNRERIKERECGTARAAMKAGHREQLSKFARLLGA